MSGAENLLGKGDMLMVTDSDTMRMQGLYISEDELSDFIEKI
jgi:DNA segregation ATPase FtsK/SpoIIIE-like protein